MANSFQTNKRTELVALRAAESAGYLTIGSKKYLKDQLIGKRNGRSFDFVIRDAGEYQEGIDLSGGTGPSDIIERKVTLGITTGNVLIQSDILDKVTDTDWDREIAYPNGKKLVNGIVKKAVNDDLGWQNTGCWFPAALQGSELPCFHLRRSAFRLHRPDDQQRPFQQRPGFQASRSRTDVQGWSHGRTRWRDLPCQPVHADGVCL